MSFSEGDPFGIFERLADISGFKMSACRRDGKSRAVRGAYSLERPCVACERLQRRVDYTRSNERMDSAACDLIFKYNSLRRVAESDFI